MKTVLSYCLFEPIHLHGHRTWDEHRLDEKRYWYNIPALYLVNKILYPEYEMKIHVNDVLRYHPLFVLLNSLDITIKEIDIPFNKTSEPMLWRMIPLWEDYDCVFTRDVDSIPNRNEFCCTTYFNNSKHAIQTLRTHENHYHEMGCDMLGGLSGFKPKLIATKPTTFKDYYDSRSDLPWAQDQFLMVNTFLKQQDRLFIEQNFLDCPIDNQKRKAPFYHSTIPSDDFSNIETNLKQDNVFNIVDDYKISEWAGQPCDTRGEILKKLLLIKNEHSNHLTKILNEKTVLKDFYKI
jgi:hypothetical protein